MSTQQPAPSVYAPAAFPTTNGLATAALVLGLVAIVTGIVPFFVGLVVSFVPTVLAIIFGIVGISRARHGASGRGLAVAGLVLGAVTFLLYFVGYGILW